MKPRRKTTKHGLTLRQIKERYLPHRDLTSLEGVSTPVAADEARSILERIRNQQRPASEEATPPSS